MLIKDFLTFQELTNYLSSVPFVGRYLVREDETLGNIPVEYLYDGIDLRQITSQSTSGEANIRQIVKTGKIVNDVDTISISSTSIIVDLYEIITSQQGVLEIQRTFDNSDSSNFEYNSNYVVFDGVAKVRGSISIPGAVEILPGGVITRFDISSFDKKNIYELEVI